MKRIVIICLILIIQLNYIDGQTVNKQINILNEIDFLKIDIENFQSVGIIQNVKNDWGKLGLRGKVDTISMVVRNQDNTTYNIRYHFDDEGKIKKLAFNNDNIYYIYTTREKLFREVHANGILHEFNYNKKNQLIGAKYSSNGIISHYGKSDYFIFTYDNNGQIIKFYNPENKITKDYIYDNNGHCIKETYSYNDENFGELQVNKSFEYNGQNDISKVIISIISTFQQYIDSINYSYEYDLHGNWLKSTSINSDSTNITEIERTIKYYQTIASGYIDMIELDEIPYEQPETEPTFPDGEEALQRFILQNLKYPVKAQGKGESGRVKVKFLVTKTGNITDIQITESVGTYCDQEVIRLVKLMPQWISGKHDGKQVNAYKTLSFNFKSQQL